MILRRNTSVAVILYLVTFTAMIYVCLVKLNPECDCSNYEKQASSRRNVQDVLAPTEKQHTATEIPKSKAGDDGKLVR